MWERKTKFIFGDKVKDKQWNKWVVIWYKESKDEYEVWVNTTSNWDKNNYWELTFWNRTRYWSEWLKLDLDTEFWDTLSDLHYSERLVKLHKEQIKKMQVNLPWYKKIF